VLAQRIDRLAPEEMIEYRVYLRFERHVEADEDGTPSLPLRNVAKFTGGKAYNDEGKEVRSTFCLETDEDMMERYPELRSEDGKMRRGGITLRFD
jgi:hypothetical protein